LSAPVRSISIVVGFGSVCLDTAGGRNETACEDAVVTERTISRARAGDEQAFRELIDPYRGEL
jgi:hypothetical protein